MRLIKRVLIIIIKAVLVTITKRILIVLEYKELRSVIKIDIIDFTNSKTFK